MLFCRGCSDGIQTESRKPVKEFPKRSKAQVFHNLLAQGMERFCIACLKSARIKQSANEELEETLPENEIEGYEKNRDFFAQCTKWEAYLQRA